MPKSSATLVKQAPVTDDDSQMLAYFAEQGLVPLQDLIAAGKVERKRGAWTPADFADRWIIFDLATLKVEPYYSRQASAMLNGVRCMAVDPQTGERRLFMSASQAIVAHFEEQIMPRLEQIAQLLPVKITCTSKIGNPAQPVWGFAQPAEAGSNGATPF